MMGINFARDQFKVFKQNVHKLFHKYDLYYLVEDCNWAIMEEGKGITSKLSNLRYLLCSNTFGITNAIVHFGSVNVFFNNKKDWDKIKKNNKIIVTWFHVVPEDKRIQELIVADKYVDLWHTSCIFTKAEMIKIGISDNKIVIIPIGIDLNTFKKTQIQEKETMRKRLGISPDQFVIGSFQKDGNGWGEGDDPKLIKGPDIFCDAIEKLAKKYSVYVVLTGPARGYVKKRLERANIPYYHTFLNRIEEVSEYYKALDLYVVASRVEGGPKAILESMATGVPIVSTQVGMAPEVIENNKNGVLVEIENIDQIVGAAEKIITDNEFRERSIQNGYHTITMYDYNQIAKLYEKLLYGEKK